MRELESQVAIVTGGSRGIGAATVRALAQAGARVAFTYVNSHDIAQTLAQDVDGYAIQADHCDPSVGERVVAQTVQHFGAPVHILVNNAGVFRPKPFNSMTLENLDYDLDMSIRNVFTLTQAVVKQMPAHGRIVLISSILGERAIMPGLVSYDTTRFGMIGFTRSLAWDLGAKNITVNAILPGPIDTDMNPANQSSMGKMTALGRFGTTTEVAHAVRFLVSPAASYITGATLRVDGGMNA